MHPPVGTVHAPSRGSAQAPTRTAGALAIALAVTALGAAPAHAAPDRVPLGHFAGYVSTGAISSVSATFTVPRIGPGSPAGSLGATWIGAQAPGSNGPFIQIGVNEYRVAAPIGAQRTFYVAFWSDTRLHFHPQALFEVAPGDAIAVSLHHVHDGWRLAIVDPSEDEQARFVTHDEAHGAFNWAEFLQENPVHGAAHRPYPYPRLTGASFRQLRVDYAPPPPESLLSQWMASQRGYLAPSAVSGDAFSLHRGQLGSGAATYIRLADPFDAATNRFDAESAHWGPATPHAGIVAESRAAASATLANIRGFARGPWRARLRPLADALVERTRALLAVVRDAPADASVDLARWRAAYARATDGVRAAAERLYAHLHGPELF